MEKYILAKPIEYDGEKITEISMDLEGLSVVDLEKAERQARLLLGKKETMQVPETNKRYQACVAAKAAGVPLDVIRSLGAKDYTQVCLLVMNFLLDGDSEEDEEEENIKPPATPSGETANSTKKPETSPPPTSTVSPSPSAPSAKP